MAKLAVPGLVGIGLALRLTYYLRSPSLSTDEASLALNLMHRSYGGLFERLDFNQAAPPGFLVLQKVVIDVFGPSPYSLRLVPFLAGAAASLLVYRFAARVGGRSAAIVALALFAVSDPLLSYASTNKQYSVDVAVTLTLYVVAFAIAKRLDTPEIVLFGIVGLVAVFLSYPSAFVLAAIWAVFLVENAILRRWPQVTRLTGLAVFWIASLAIAYLLTRASIEQIQRSVAVGWGKPSAALKTLGGIARYLLSVPAFTPEVRAGITCIAIVLCFVGIQVLVKRSLGLAVVLVAPALLAGAAVSIDRYPNFPRTFLFLGPTLIVLIAIGTESLLSPRRPQVVRAGAGLGIAVLVCVGAFQTFRHLRSSAPTEHTRTLSYLFEHARSGDSLYISRSAQYTFRYYVECNCLAKSRVAAKASGMWPIQPIAGYGQFDAALKSSPPFLVAGSKRSTDRGYAGDFAPLLGRRRVWILFVDPDPRGKEPLTRFLRNHGRRLGTFPDRSENAVASLFLYNLRPPRNTIRGHKPSTS